MSSDLMDSSDGLMCNACQITISSAEQRSEHYKSEWHRYNVKRRCAGLASITQQLFASQLAALNRQQQEQTRQSASQKCTTCNKTFSSESSYEAHLITKTHLKRAAKGEEEPNMKKSSKQQKKRIHQPVVATSLPSQKEDTTITSTPATVTTTPAPATLSTSTDTKEDGDVNMDSVSDDDFEDVDGIQTPAIPAEHCLFCNRHISTFTDLLDHMLKQHGFFIPFIEHCTDLSSFIDYLGVKVGVGRVCLYCNGRGRARYPSVRSVQQHMMAKHHCKLRFEDDEEYEEYSEFFTFPDDDIDDEVESEDVPMSSRDRLEMLKKNSSTSTSTSASTKRHLTGMNDAGELVLSDGSTIGHRSLVNIYKQNFRPREVRESVKINQLMAEYRALEMPGYLVNKTRSDNVPVKVQRRINRVREKTNLAANFQHHFRPQVDF